MSESEKTATEEVVGGAESVERALGEHLRAAEGAGERVRQAGLAREIAGLSADTALAAVEVSAQLAPLSFRAAVEFLRAVPGAAQLLEAEELRAWGEMGRRLVMADVETGAAFYAAGVAGLAEVPRAARPGLLRVCVRQMSLSTSIATETFRDAPALATAVGDAEHLASAYEIAVEIARRSARHSAEFLEVSPRVFAHFAHFAAEDRERAARASLRAMKAFAARAGGIAAEAWAALPEATRGLDAEGALALLRQTETFLERGGAAALHVLAAGGEVLRLEPGVFADWVALLRAVAEQGNAQLVALARSSPPFFRALARSGGADADSAELTRRVLASVREVARLDAEAAISALRSAPTALRAATVEQYERWAREGLTAGRATPRARRSYYALETRQSNEALRGAGQPFGLALDEVAQTLRLYVEGLTGRAVDVASLATLPEESRIGDGRTIHLPAAVAEFADDALNFRLYKVLAAHSAGQIEFGTHARAGGGGGAIPEVNHDLRAAFASLSELYDAANRDALDAFALDGYINDPSTSEPALAPEEELRRARATRSVMPPDADYRAALALFPLTALAVRIFSTLENGRIDRRLRHAYRGLARDLDMVREHLRSQRPRVATLPTSLVPFELLFQITLCGGALDDARNFYGPVVSELETIVADYLSRPDSTVADTLMATSRVYTLFQSVSPADSDEPSLSAESEDKKASGAESSVEREQEEGGESGEASERARPRETQRDARELFNSWAKSDSHDADSEQQLSGAERWAVGESPEQALGEGETAFEYDEWDRELSDTRVSWCRVVEKRPRLGERTFVEITRSRYRGVISSIRHQFQLMKPETLTRVRNEIDGDDYNLDAVVDHVVDRRAARSAGGGQPSERLYVKRLRRQRDVAVSFLLDQSSSTARTIGRHPLQPYTHPGRRIIDIEKEGLVLMSEALEAVGDAYSIYGFTSEGRRNVKFYVVKDFSERYSEETERLIGGLNYQHNTRLGAAVRHAAARLSAQEARTRLLIVLSDGRPYDHDYGDARYAREDTREALREARISGITPFCITIDRDSESELRDLYGDVGYTIIDDVLSLPERMPAIYRRLTT